MWILVIDDHEVTRTELAAALEAAGHDVMPAGSAAEALECLRQAATDIVIAEIRMPGMAGLEAIKAIRRRRPDIRIVSISGGGRGVPAHTALTLARAFGTDRVIYRPYRQDELLAALDDRV